MIKSWVMVGYVPERRQVLRLAVMDSLAANSLAPETHGSVAIGRCRTQLLLQLLLIESILQV